MKMFWTKYGIFETNWKESVFVFVSSVAVMSFIYSPVLKFGFAWHDDFFSWVWNRESCTTHPLFGDCMARGRPISAYLVCWIAYPLGLYGLSATPLVRFTTILFIALNIYLTSRWLILSSFSRVTATMLSMAIFTLPFAQVCVPMAYNMIEIISMIPVTVGTILAYKGLSQRPKQRSCLVLFLLLTLLSLCIYQNGAMYFWTLLAIPLLSTSEVQSKIPILYRRLVGWTFVSYVLYFMLTRILLSFSPWKEHWWRNYGTAHIPLKKIGLFFNHIIPMATGPWNRFLERIWAGDHSFLAYHGYSLVLFGGGAVFVIRLFVQLRHHEVSRDALLVSIKRFVLILCIVPLTVLPNLVGRPDGFSFRMAGAISPLFLFLTYRWLEELLCLVLRSNDRRRFVMSFVAGGLLLYGGLTAHEYVYKYYVFPQTNELSLFGEALRSASLRAVNRIHVVQLGGDKSRSAPFPFMDEYGTSLSHYGQDLRGILIALLQDIGDNESLDRFRSSLQNIKKTPGRVHTAPPLFLSASGRQGYHPLKEATRLVELDGPIFPK